MDLRVLVRYGLALLSLAAAILHLSAAQDHSGDDLVVALFVVGAWAQAGWGLLVATREARWVLYAGIALNGGAIAVWAISRTVGIDIGTHLTGAAEPVGVKDAVTVSFELVMLVGVVGLLGPWLDSIRVGSLALGRRALWFLGATVFALSVPAFLASSHTHTGRHALHRGAQAGGERLSEQEQAEELRRIERLEGLSQKVSRPR